MKKIILILAILLIPLTAYADFLPHNTKSIRHYGIGVLNKPDNFVVYSEPDFNSEIIKEIHPEKQNSSSIINSNSGKLSLKDSYIAMVKKNNIALLTVETAQENGWYEIYINQKSGKTGWIYDKDSKFYTWKGLFTLYSKSNGLRFMHGVPDNIQTLYSADSFDSQVIKVLEYPSKITFSMIKGNWMLVTVREFDGSNNIGWLKWRNEDGSLNLFPIF